jgi:hypothetical protein
MDEFGGVICTWALGWVGLQWGSWLGSRYHVTRLGSSCASARKQPLANPQPTTARYRIANMKPATATTVKKTAYPSPLSISELISAYPRERLYVHPLLWTRRHLSLLGCEFSDDGILSIPPPPTTIHPPSTHNQLGIGNDNEATWVELHFAEQYSDTNKARCLATSKRLHDKCWSLGQLLKEFEYNRWSLSLSFNFSYYKLR